MATFGTILALPQYLRWCARRNASPIPYYVVLLGGNTSTADNWRNFERHVNDAGWCRALPSCAYRDIFAAGVSGDDLYISVFDVTSQKAMFSSFRRVVIEMRIAL